MNTKNADFDKKVKEARARLLSHPIYGALKDLQSLQIFMKYHVFAVWDFMTLLKSLQRSLTCVEIPWVPRENTRTARFINEIVLCEETDEISDGVYFSHYELYLKAMEEVGADTKPIKYFVNAIKEIPGDSQIVKNEGGIWDFVGTTISLATSEKHKAAAAFLYGREDIIPEMFLKILNEIAGTELEKYSYFRKYLERHIEVDSQSHGPLARKMLQELCGDSEVLWKEAAQAATAAIDARTRLWGFVNSEIVEDADLALSVLLGA